MDWDELPGLSRRAALGVLFTGLALPAAEAASTDAIGQASDVRGKVIARRRPEGERSLANGSRLRLLDSVETRAQSFARLDLSGRTTIHLGSSARLTIDRFIAESGGVLRLGQGALLLDRPDHLPKIDLTIRSRFGLIAVRGTRFFAGPSRGVFGVFVARGSVRVTAAGVRRVLTAGEGVGIEEGGGEPGPVKPWGKARIAEAYDSVGL